MSKALATKYVASVLVASALVLGFGLAIARPAKADQLSQLQAQVQALLAQIAQLQAQSGTGTTGGTTGGACYTFTMNLKQGASNSEVMQLQKFLNSHGYTVAATGAGSAGNETNFFGPATKAAVIKWQDANAASVLTPVGLSKGTGYWGPSSRAAANAMCTTTGTGTTGTGTTTPSGAGLTVTAGTQPAATLAPMNATRVPFTTFTLTNNTSAAVTINGVTVQRTGLANDNAFAGVVLLDQNGIQLGNSQTFNSNHQATIGGTFTLNAGQSMTYTVAGNMETTAGGYSGQIASIAIVGVNTSVPVSGSLPITGASNTVNETLTIGTATVGLSGFDPNSSRSEPIGTTGLTFSGVRITAGSAEDEKLYSITWNQTGSVGSTDMSNLVTVVNGTSYPVTVDASGKYYTSTFPGGVLITKGNSVDAYIKGDLTGSSSSGRTVEFDIYRATDIYIVGQSYGYGITPSFKGSNGTYSAGNNSQSGFQASANPFYFGSTVTVTGGQLSTVSTASSVAPQNIAVNVPNQVLGGFQTNFTGEPVTVQSVKVSVASSTTGTTQLQNVTLVDSNGNVVAGPVDENVTTQTISFSSSITFPTGPMTYTIKGTVASGANNGATYTLSTNPSTDWTSPVGQTSGTYLTLTNTTLTMSTMTVQSGQLSIAATAAPAATTVTKNSNNYTVANILLDASQSGEDVRLNALPVIISATSSTDASDIKTNLTNCQLYNGSTVLNSTAVGSSQWATVTGLAHSGGELSVYGVESNFIFTNSLTVPKGTTVTLALECTIGGALYNGEQFSAGVDHQYTPTVTGATSGNTITPTVTSGTSGTMTIGTPSMQVNVSTPTYSQAAGGTSGVPLGSFTLQPNSGSVGLQYIGLKMNSTYANPADLAGSQVTIVDQNNNTVGTVVFNPANLSGGYYYGTTTVNTTLTQDTPATFTVKGNLATIGSGSGNSGTSGHEILIGLSDAQGTSGNSSVNSGPGTMPTQNQGVAIFRSFLTSVSKVALPTTGVSDGSLLEYSVTANSQGPIGIDQFVFNVSTSTGVAITNPQLYWCDGGTAGCTPNTLVANGVNGATTWNPATQIATTTLATPLQIQASHTVYFLLRAATLNCTGGSCTTYTAGATLQSDGADLSPNMVSGATATSSYNFVWSPNSTTTTPGTGNDWTNGYGITNLPSFGISSSRSN